ncbi:hypothetical protein TcasGA2_TC032836 [Tribolium castaneum]|uniref:Uncharacterized protein n=1 Tax=Tribolium castaneum TaxID=7070 RepID=A0A139WJ19_TRICA|nr:hypothetical protein TcasGA2_TC032836 [Tribolium castaneum]
MMCDCRMCLPCIQGYNLTVTASCSVHFSARPIIRFAFHLSFPMSKLVIGTLLSPLCVNVSDNVS